MLYTKNSIKLIFEFAIPLHLEVLAFETKFFMKIIAFKLDLVIIYFFLPFLSMV